MVFSGRAVPVSVLPVARPMRRVPKSMPRTRTDGARSGMPAGGLQRGRLYAQRGHGPRPAVVQREVENDRRIGRGIEPGVFLEVILEGASRPAGLTQGHDVLRRPA